MCSSRDQKGCAGICSIRTLMTVPLTGYTKKVLLLKVDIYIPGLFIVT
jgi:hypothetical protein